MSAPAASPAELLLSSAAYAAAYRGAANLKLSIFSALAVLVYDRVLTFNTLRRHVWPRKLSLTKVAVLYNYWWPVLVHGSLCTMTFFNWIEADCVDRHLSFLHPVVCLLSLVGAQVVLLLRVVAVYGHVRLVSFGIIGLFVVCQAGAIACLAKLQPAAFPPGIDGCALVLGLPQNFLIFLGPIIFESVATVVVAVHTFRRDAHSHRGLLARLARDDLAYFLLVVLINVANMALVAANPAPIAGLLLWMPTVTVTVIAANRIMLDVESDDLLSVGRRVRPGPAEKTTGGVVIDASRHVAVIAEEDEDAEELKVTPKRRGPFVVRKLDGTDQEYLTFDDSASTSSKQQV